MRSGERHTKSYAPDVGEEHSAFGNKIAVVNIVLTGDVRETFAGVSENGIASEEVLT